MSGSFEGESPSCNLMEVKGPTADSLVLVKRCVAFL